MGGSQLKLLPLVGIPNQSTSPLWGGVGEGVLSAYRNLAPPPQPSPLKGEGVARSYRPQAPLWGAPNSSHHPLWGLPTKALPLVGIPNQSTSPLWGGVGEGVLSTYRNLAPPPQPSPLKGEGVARSHRLQAPLCGEEEGFFNGLLKGDVIIHEPVIVFVDWRPAGVAWGLVEAAAATAARGVVAAGGRGVVVVIAAAGGTAAR